MSIFDFFTREAGQERRRALEGLLTQFIPPEMRPQLGLLAEAQPIRGAERAGQGAVRVMNTQGMDRVQAIGDTLSEMAGVVAPAMAAGRAGVPVANAVQEVLTGYAPAVQPFLVDEFGGVGVPSFRAFHGSPHDFDRFDMSKIGTGEGAQAYGHGLYFAEAEDVARSYRDALSLDAGFSYKGREGLTREQLAEAIAADYGGKYLDNIITPRGVADGVMDELIYGPSQRKLGPERAALREKLLAEIQRTDPGRMYEVQINADPNDFLDWDKPFASADDLERFAARFDAVDPALRKRIEDFGYVRQQMGQPMPDGNDIIREVMGGIGSKDAMRASEAMREAGIPGIRYLDAGSRGAGDGSRNYVVFDDKLIDIVRKYGIAGAAAMLGVSALDVEQAMAQGQQQPQGLLSGAQ